MIRRPTATYPTSTHAPNTVEGWSFGDGTTPGIAVP
jgi:hypothetical protein